VTEADVERVAQRFDGFNIKLVKCGGITPARRMAQRGTRSAAVDGGLHAGEQRAHRRRRGHPQRTDYADLDGAWLIGDDPFKAGASSAECSRRRTLLVSA